MKKLNEFLIPFIGLKLGKHQFEYQISKEFFDNFDYDEFESANIKVNVAFEKKSTLMELNFKHNGTIHVPCDLTNEMFDFPIKGKLKVIVKFGEEYNDDNDDYSLASPHIYVLIILRLTCHVVSCRMVWYHSIVCCLGIG